MEEHSNVIIKPKLRHGADLVVLFFLVGFFLLGFAALMIATGFVERLNVAMAQVNRFESIDSYPGRPEPAAATGSSQINYLLLASDSQKDLHAAMVLNVSSDRNKLTLLVFSPSVTGVGKTTLGEAFSNDPALIWRNMELLTGTRMDHQMIVWLDETNGVVRAMDGLALVPDGEKIEASKLSGWISAALNENERALRIAETMRALLQRLSIRDALSNPSQYEEIVKNLSRCLAVDGSFNGDDFLSMIMELRVGLDKIETFLISDTFGQQADRGVSANDLSSAYGTTAPVTAHVPELHPQNDANPHPISKSSTQQKSTVVEEVDAVSHLRLREAFKSEDFSILR